MRKSNVLFVLGLSLAGLAWGCSDDKDDVNGGEPCTGNGCDVDEGCSVKGCENGLLCSPTTDRCVESLTPDESCVKTGCPTGFTCNAMTGQCEENANPQQSCVDTGCTTGTCNATTGKCEEDTNPQQSCVDTGCYGDYECNTTTGQCEPGGELDGTGCTYTAGGSVVVLKGDVLTLDEVIVDGIVVVDGERISYVGPESSADVDISGATRIECPSAVISPGLINGHDHITYTNRRPDNWGDERFAHRHEWRRALNEHSDHTAGSTSGYEDVGELRQLISGSTSLFGSGNAAGLMRNIDKEAVGNVSKSTYDTFPLKDSGGTMHDSGCTGYSYGSPTDFSNVVAYGPHIAEGINAAAINELRCLSSTANGGRDIFNDKLAIIHGVAADPALIRMMAANDVKLIWSPRTNISLYGDTAMAPLYDRLGVTIALGTDWTPSGSINILRELQCVDFMNQHYYNQHFSDADLWRMATYNGAVAFHLESEIGQLKKGLLADIAIFRQTPTRRAHRAVIDAGPGDVMLVMVGGKVAFGDENIVDVSGCDVVDVCGVSKKACPKNVGGKYTWTETRNRTLNAPDVKDGMNKNQIHNAKYDLFFCGVPDDEPTCVPLRTRPDDTKGTTVYEGDYSDPDDIDGDGIPNDQDNCPTFFNPIRPQDTDGQADADGDGIGDICDEYVFCAANDETCPEYDPKDFDGDGVPNATDNCPDIPNSDQLDTDNDKKGDACDECPDIANPGSMRCPLDTINTIAQVNDAVDKACPDKNKNCSSDSVEVRTRGQVTYVSSRGFFIQDPDGGAKRSAIYIYLGSQPSDVAVNDLVEVQGYIANYYGLPQLSDNQYSVISNDNAALEPIDFPKTIQDFRDYVGMLARVTNVELGSDSQDDKNNIIYPLNLTDLNSEELNLGSYYYSLWNISSSEPAVAVGNHYNSVNGIIVREQNKYKISPRNQADLVEGLHLSSLEAVPAMGAWGSTVKVVVTMSEEATEDVQIELTCTNATCPRSATVRAGESEMTFEVTMGNEDATIVASYGKHSITLEIPGYDASSLVTVASVSPASIRMKAGTTSTVSVGLSRPAASGDVLKVTSDSDKFTVPASIPLAENSVTASFDVSSAAGAQKGDSAQITVQIGSTAAKVIDVLIAAGFDALHSVSFENETSSGYSKTTTIDLGDGITATAVANFNDNNYINDMVMTGSKNNPTSFVVSGVTGVGSITIDYVSYAKNDEPTLNVTVGDVTKSIKFSTKSGTPGKDTLTFEDEDATQFTIAPAVSTTTNNGDNRIAIKSVSWTSMF